MNSSNLSFEIYRYYNLTRYLFLALEQEYSNIVEPFGITLPQLRILWCLYAFPNINSTKIASAGNWSLPTVSKILKKLEEKKFVFQIETENKKTKIYSLTDLGLLKIEECRQRQNTSLSLFKLFDSYSEDDLKFMISILKYPLTDISPLTINYIEKVAHLDLKLEKSSFKTKDHEKLRLLVYFFNYLRILVLNIENSHSLKTSTFGITYPQLRSLKILLAFPGKNSLEMSNLGRWSASTANLIVKNLYSKDLIYKEKGISKNTLHLFATNEAESLVKNDFFENESNLEIIKKLRELPLTEISRSNDLLLSMNILLENTFVSEYIDKTYGLFI